MARSVAVCPASTGAALCTNMTEPVAPRRRTPRRSASGWCVFLKTARDIGVVHDGTPTHNGNTERTQALHPEAGEEAVGAVERAVDGEFHVDPPSIYRQSEDDLGGVILPCDG